MPRRREFTAAPKCLMALSDRGYKLLFANRLNVWCTDSLRSLSIFKSNTTFVESVFKRFAVLLRQVGNNVSFAFENPKQG